MDDTYSVIEYSIDGGHTWHHGRSVESWVVADQGALAGQRAATREYARTEHGDVETVTTRVLAGDDPRGVLNQPRPAPQADRLQGGFKVLSVFEDHSAGGLSRWVYAMHKDGRVMVANSDRTLPVSDDNLRHPRFYPETERDQARETFLARCAQYCTPSFKVHD